MNILYVEDEPSDSQLVALYVNTTSHQLVIAQNAREAREAFVQQHPDLILIDVMLSNAREGYSLIREFRAQSFVGPVIAITALTTPKDVEECQKAGFDHIVHKPFVMEQLAEIIDRYAL